MFALVVAGKHESAQNVFVLESKHESVQHALVFAGKHENTHICMLYITRVARNTTMGDLELILNHIHLQIKHVYKTLNNLQLLKSNCVGGHQRLKKH